MDIAQPPHRDDLTQCLNYFQMQGHNTDTDIPRRSPRRPKVMPLADYDMDTLEKRSSIPLVHDSLAGDYSMVGCDESESGNTTQNSSSRSSLFSLENDTTLSSREPLRSALVEEYLDEIALDDEICCVDNVVTIVKCHDQAASRRVVFVATQ
ncbi:hypothetical protein JCM33374_g3177 [Metschnikowia sp. JCM 33374]|nr:hypothetical protein JCM33374_g3177 [Metschnikowia sp. JCM 33374]